MEQEEGGEEEEQVEGEREESEEGLKEGNKVEGEKEKEKAKVLIPHFFPVMSTE